MRKLNKASSPEAMFSPFSRPLGILGGGQLARMLCLRAHALGIPVAVLSENAEDPAAQVSALWRKGSLTSRRDLATFLKACSVVTFESEFLDARLLGELASANGCEIYPRPEHMALIQDRLSQKQLLHTSKIPTAPFFAVETAEQARVALKTLGGRAVFKKRRFGYDGYGTFVVRTVKELEAFLPELGKTPQIGFIAEKFIPFKREIAIMVGRSVNGTTVSLPFVESFQENSRCLWVAGPLRASPRLTKLARSLETFLSKLGYVGMMGVELFETKSGDWIVNELAPRVHNTGHYSMDALSEDQFGLHLKAILDLPFAKPRALSGGFAMYNLLGVTGGDVRWTLVPDIALHWYGKHENRPGRKMGHFNVLGKNPKDALKRAQRARQDFSL